ncbi:MAG TPA: twin-arginine translocase subunit TatC [Candidatus Acidoferrum sp.]|nr:twin-arginine translocase subunit TatC [Candidatus Acidoferrum sp.]
MVGTSRATKPSKARDQFEVQQTFLEHLLELRARLFWVALALVAGGTVGWIFQDRIASFLLAPLRGKKLVYMNPTGGFDFIIKISLYVGVVVAIPVAVYQVYRYISPLIKRQRNRRFAAFVIVFSASLAVAGVLFGYYVVIPSALHFLTNFAGQYVSADLTATAYLDFMMMHSLGMAALFQLPVVLLFINTLRGPIKPIKLLKSEQYILLGSVIMGGFLAPPDLKNQALVVLPIFGSYQLGVLAVLLQNRRRAIVSMVPERKLARETFVVAAPKVAAQAQVPQAIRRAPSLPIAKPAVAATCRPVMDIMPAKHARPLNSGPRPNPLPSQAAFVRPRPARLIDGMFITSRSPQTM